MITHLCHCGDHAFAKTKTNAGIVIVDAQDINVLAAHTWGAQRRRKTFYAVSWIGGNLIKLHQMIAGKYPDHKNRNGLDNRRENLRPGTSSKNAQNRGPIAGKKFLGVFYDSRRPSKPFMASIGHNRKTVHLGRFSEEEDAARAYDAAAEKLYGSNAYFNFPRNPGGTRENLPSI
jgi:hypothetical protein